MGAIRDAGKVKARERIAVLAALNLAYQLAQRGDKPSARSGKPPSRDGGAADVQIDTLIARIDAAMGSDGHLL
jgi:cell division protein ZapA